jgi:hypothetical protein
LLIWFGDPSCLIWHRHLSPPLSTREYIALVMFVLDAASLNGKLSSDVTLLVNFVHAMSVISAPLFRSEPWAYYA